MNTPDKWPRYFRVPRPEERHGLVALEAPDVAYIILRNGTRRRTIQFTLSSCLQASYPEVPEDMAQRYIMQAMMSREEELNIGP